MSATTLIIGDIHGCADELDALLDQVGPDRVVLVGDLFTKGPAPERVWARIRDGGFDAVLGNHDDRLLRIVAGGRQDDVSGRAVADRLYAADPGWLPWLHARPLVLPLTVADQPFVVVHAGLRPDGDVDATTRDACLTLRHWPPTPVDDAPRPLWWQVYTGALGVVFGHDAARGLVRVERDGKPLLIGLDSGCVYGGALTGWVPEADRTVSVPARAPYAPIRGARQGGDPRREPRG